MAEERIGGLTPDEVTDLLLGVGAKEYREVRDRHKTDYIAAVEVLLGKRRKEGCFRCVLGLDGSRKVPRR